MKSSSVRHCVFHLLNHRQHLILDCWCYWLIHISRILYSRMLAVDQHSSLLVCCVSVWIRRDRKSKRGDRELLLILSQVSTYWFLCDGAVISRWWWSSHPASIEYIQPNPHTWRQKWMGQTAEQIRTQGKVTELIKTWHMIEKPELQLVKLIEVWEKLGKQELWKSNSKISIGRELKFWFQSERFCKEKQNSGELKML